MTAENWSLYDVATKTVQCRGEYENTTFLSRFRVAVTLRMGGNEKYAKAVSTPYMDGYENRGDPRPWAHG